MLGHPLQTLGFSSTPVTRPSKRPRLELEEELQLEDDPSEGSSSLAASEGQDLTYDPAESVTVLSQSPSYPICRCLYVSECACGDGSSLDKNSAVMQ